MRAPTVTEDIPEIDSFLLPLEPYFSVTTVTAHDFQQMKRDLPVTVTNEEADDDLDRHHKMLLESSDDAFSPEEHGHPFYIDTENGYLNFEDSDSRNAEKNIRHYLYAINKDLVLIRYHKLTSSGWIFADRADSYRHDCIGFPVFSHDSTRILVASSSIPQKDDERGFQYYKRENQKWILKWKIPVNKWFADELYWLNDSTVICRKVFYHKTDLRKDHDSIQYLQLKFKNS